MKTHTAFIIALLLLSCKPGKDTTAETDITGTTERYTTSDQTSIGLIIDEGDSLPQMPVTGVAENLKGGATINTKTHRFWIDDLMSWEDRYLGNPVRVWGDIEIRYDAPVFLDTSENVSQGIPVESEEEMKRQSKRYWIVNAKYELVRP